MTPAAAVLTRPSEDEQEDLRLWDGLEVPARTSGISRAPVPAPSRDWPGDRVTPVGPVPLVLPSAPTLEDLVAGAWDGLLAGAAAACPVCSEPMRPRWSAGAGVVGGHCEACGTGVT